MTPWVLARRRSPALTDAAGVLAAAGVLCILLSGLDGREVLGVSTWLKPMKFAFSLAVFLITMAWLVGYLEPRHPRTVRYLGRGIAAGMLLEFLLIAVQAARGVPSHFNAGTPWDHAVFLAMGITIGLVTLQVGWVALLSFRGSTLPPGPLRSGLRLGLLVFLFACAQGGYIIGEGASTVGVAPGGPGWPVVGWSTEGGDLRLAHFLGVHGLQVLPLLGWWLERRQGPRGVAWVRGAGLAYLVLVGFTFLRAIAGHPLPELHP